MRFCISPEFFGILLLHITLTVHSGCSYLVCVLSYCVTTGVDMLVKVGGGGVKGQTPKLITFRILLFLV